MLWIPNPETAMNNEVLRVEGMSVGFLNQEGQCVAVTDDVSFSIARGEVFALVGESGCGKSVTAMGLLGLLPRPGAKILSGIADLQSQDLLKMAPDHLRKIRGKIASVIFQEPGAAMNPVRRIQGQLLEALPELDKSKTLPMVESLMKGAGFSDVKRVLDSYPHELSGGMLQRVMIVMALLSDPALLIADEPTTALDVTVQAQVMGILRKLCAEKGTGLLLITHNLGLVAQYADRVAVMYAGRIVEVGTTLEILKTPKHPYTQGLLAAIPEGHSHVGALRAIPGTVPRPHEFDEGCRFRMRCSFATPECSLRPSVQNMTETHQVSCFHPQGVGLK